MEASRRATLALVSRLPEEDVLRPRTFDRWSIKDVLAHVVAWEEETVRRLHLIARGRLDRVHWFHELVGADRFNARAATAGRRQSLAALLRRMARVRRQLVTALRR